MSTLANILGYRNLTGITRAIMGDLPKVLPSGFFTNTRRIYGNQATYLRTEGTRQTARLTHYGDPSHRREQAGITEIPVRLLHSFEHQFHNVSTLTQLQRFDNPEIQRLGEQEIARQTAEFATLFRNLRVAAVQCALVNGLIWADSDGNLLPDATDATYTIDFAIPAGNQNDIDGIIGASWATAGTDIVGDVTAIKDAAIQNTGWPLKYAFYGANVLGYLLTNTQLQNLINGNPTFSQSFGQMEIPPGFLGLNWIPASNAFYVDNDSTVQTWWGGDTVVFTPEPTPEWFETYLGSYAIPNSIDVGSDVNNVLGNMTEVFGSFSYAHAIADPPAIKQLSGDTWLPIIKNPSVIYQADVTP